MLLFDRWTQPGSQKEFESFPCNISRELKNSCSMFVEDLPRMLAYFAHAAHV
jgi:hypothetical protein